MKRAARGVNVGSYLALSVVLLGLAPAMAHANRLKVTRYQLEPNAAVIELEGDQPIGEHWLKITGSTVRIWFPKIDKPSRFDQGDGEQAVRAVRLRGSTGETALLALELSPDRSPSRDEVEVTRDGTQALVRVALSSQPAAEPVVKATPAAATATPAARNSIPATGANAAAAPAPASHVSPTQAPDTAAPPALQFKGGTPAPVPAPAAAPAKQQARKEPQLLETKHGLSTMQLLIAATIMLGGIYLALRVWQRRAPIALHPSIQLLGSKRLGARHQLLIVRALGQDHLLSVNGGRTERITSIDTPAAAGSAARPAEPIEQRRPDPNEGIDPLGSGMAATLRSLRSRALFKQPRAAAEADHAETGDSSPFGAELLELVRNQERRPELGSTDPHGKARLTESEAIAGLVRLRQRSS